MASQMLLVGQGSGGRATVTYTPQLNSTGANGFSDDTLTILQNPDSPGNSFEVDLAAGANVIAVPANCAQMIFQPPVNNVIAVTWRGVTWSTGQHMTIPYGNGSQSVSPPASETITAAAPISGCTVVQF